MNLYLLRKRSVDGAEDQLIVLRRWNSVTPRNPAGNGGGQGGGFFLVWNGHGIAIDPGYDFVDNLCVAGYSVNDIDLILATHAHDDHTAEIETIYSLRFKADKLRKHLTANSLSDEVIEETVGRMDPHDLDLRPRAIEFYGSKGPLIKFAQLLKNNWSTSVTIAKKSNQMQINSLLAEYDIELDWCDADHGEMPWMQNSTSLSYMLRLRKSEGTVRIGFTGDTKYQEKTCQLMSDLDVLVLNLGSYKDEDSDHLGEIGASELLFRANPRLAVITEFGNELESLRDIVTFEVDERMWFDFAPVPYGRYPVVLPADIGFSVLLSDPDLSIMTQCFTNPVPPRDVGYFDPVRRQGQGKANPLHYTKRQ